MARSSTRGHKYYSLFPVSTGDHSLGLCIYKMNIKGILFIFFSANPWFSLQSPMLKILLHFNFISCICAFLSWYPSNVIDLLQGIKHLLLTAHSRCPQERSTELAAKPINMNRKPPPTSVASRSSLQSCYTQLGIFIWLISAISSPLYFIPILVLFPSFLQHYPFWSLSVTCNGSIWDYCLQS